MDTVSAGTCGRVDRVGVGGQHCCNVGVLVHVLFPVVLVVVLVVVMGMVANGCFRLLWLWFNSAAVSYSETWNMPLG